MGLIFRTQLAIWPPPLLLLAAFLISASCQPSHASQGATTETASKASPAHQDELKGCSVKTDGKTTMAGCFPERFVIMLPGSDYDIDWTFTRDIATAPAVILDGKADHFQVSVRVAPESERAYSIEEHLQGVYKGAASGLQASGALRQFAPRVGPARTKQTLKNHHSALLYDVDFAGPDGRSLRSVNGWTSLRRQDGSVLDYHVSWTGSPDTNAAKPGAASTSIESSLLGFLDMFVVVDADGRKLP
jgi:hypothetical protein